jgi:signal transduction histidine kinase
MAEQRFAELISKIAHELRSPLTSIKGFSATLVKRWDRFTDEQRLQFVETIMHDADRMGRIVSEVLDLARIEAGRLELTKTDASVAAACDKAVEHCSHLPGAERVRVDVSSELSAWADPERLERLVANLVENAVKFSEEGDIVVTADADGDSVAISVRDHGVGIDEDRLPDLFAGPAPHEGRDAMPTGTGLGLYLTRRLVEIHGGEIGVETRRGEGSTFTIRLPAREKSAVA